MIFREILIYIVCNICFDSKVVDDLKRLSFQLTSSEVNIFCLRWTFAIILRVKYCRICDFVYLVDKIIKAKKHTKRQKMYFWSYLRSEMTC